MLTVLLANLIANIDVKSDSFLINYKRRCHKIKMRRYLILLNKWKRKRIIIPKVHNYFEQINKYPSEEFHKYFGMLPSTFKLLENSLKPFWARAILGRLGYSREKCLYVTLWKLCNSKVTFRELSDQFNVAKGTVHKIFYKTVELICLLKNEIKWPPVSQQQTIIEHFKNSTFNTLLPSVVGCVHATDISISMPIQGAGSYYNCKGKYTVKIQAICDSRFRFLDVFIGCPGNCDDEQVWKISPIYKAIVSNQVEVAENAVILGDSGYPLSKVLMRPYRDNGNLTNEEKQFNNCLGSTRAFTQQTYGILRKKFKILNHIDLVSVEKASKVIFACTILHNFIINRETLTE